MEISVIVPVYNVEKYIKRTMESLAMQSFRDFQVILVDDGSKDHSIDEAKTVLENSDLNYKIILKENEGVSATRNRGILEAEGKYVYFLDSDDIIHSTFLEKMYKKAESDNADIVFCGYTHIKDGAFDKGFDENMDLGPGNDNVMLRVHKYLDKPEKGLKAAARMLKNDFWISAITGMYKREMLIDNNLKYDTHIIFGEDTVFAIEALMNANIVTSVNEPLAFYIRRDSSISRTADERYFNLHESNVAIMKYNEEKFNDKEIMNSLLHYKMPHSIIRIFTSLAKAGCAKERLLEFVKREDIKRYLQGFRVDGKKENLKFKAAAVAIVTMPSLAYKLLAGKV